MSEGTSSAHVAGSTTKRNSRRKLIAIVTAVAVIAGIIAYIAYGPKPTWGTQSQMENGSVRVEYGNTSFTMNTDGVDGFFPKFENVVPGKVVQETVTFTNTGTTAVSFSFKGGVPMVEGDPDVSETYLEIVSDGREVLPRTALPALINLNNRPLFTVPVGGKLSYDLRISMNEKATKNKPDVSLSVPVKITGMQA